MSAQLRLNLERQPDHARAAFTLSDSNLQAVQALDAWPDWRGGALALVGPPGSGKTHLACIWAQRLGASAWTPEASAATAAGPLLVEDADRRVPEETLFHLLNLASRPGGGLLLTSRTPPSQWAVQLPDLRSRLKALPVAAIAEPDDTVLDAMLRKFFRERNIRPSEELLGYLVRRIERSAQSASSIVIRLDEASHASHRAVSRSLARLVLGDEPGETVEPA